MEDRKRQMHERSLANLKLGAQSRSQGKVRHNFSLLPETMQWLKGTGNASDAIDALVDSAKNGGLSSSNTHNGNNEQAKFEAKLKAQEQEISQLRSQLATTKTELENEQAKLPAANLEVARDQFLAGLKLGRQAPEYRRSKLVIDRFIAELKK